MTAADVGWPAGAGRWLACACLVLLGGCATRAEVQIQTLPVDEGVAMLEPPPHPVSDGNDEARDGHLDSELWRSLAAGRALQDCGYAPGIERWARRIAGSPKRWSAELDRVAPWIDWVWREAQALELPAEVALLPLVESGYRPVIGGYGAPGGWWQLMPDTARHLGLRVDRSHDERMEPLAASLAALGMLKQLGERFEGNWLLALVAYNVGPLHVDRWLKKAGLEIAAVTRVEQLPVPRVTVEHMHRMMAYGCLIAESDKYQLELPELTRAEQLSRVMLKQAVPSAAIPATLGERGAEWRAQNPQLLRLRRLEEGRAVLAPADLNARIAVLGDLGRYASVDPTPTAQSKVPARAKVRADGRIPKFHAVRSGDSLWLIARRYQLRVNDLLALNPKLTRKSVLRLKQQIRLQ